MFLSEMICCKATVLSMKPTIQNLLVLCAIGTLAACNSANLNTAKTVPLNELTVPGDISCMSNNYHEDKVNEAKSMVLPVSLSRARELIIDGAIPFGFSMPKDFDREAEFITNSPLLVKLNKSHEPKIGVKLEPVTSGNRPATRIIVETNSTELVMKGRQHPFTGAILQHTACLYNLFDVQLSKARVVVPTAQILPKNALAVDLVLARSISTQDAQLGDTVPLIVRHDVLLDGQLIIPKGSKAWGKISSIKTASRFMKGGNLALELSHVDFPNGQKQPLKFKQLQEGKAGENTGGNFVAAGLTGGLLMVATVGLILPFIDGDQAVMRAGTEISGETQPAVSPN